MIKKQSSKNLNEMQKFYKECHIQKQNILMPQNQKLQQAQLAKLDPHKLFYKCQKDIKQKYIEQIQIAGLNDFKISPMNKETHFNYKNGYPCSSIEQQQDSDISVQGLSPLIINNPANQNQQKLSKMNLLEKSDLAKNITNSLKKNNSNQNLQNKSRNDIRVIAQNNQKKKLLNGFKLSIENQKQYLESCLQNQVINNQSPVQNILKEVQQERQVKIHNFFDDPSICDLQDEDILSHISQTQSFKNLQQSIDFINLKVNKVAQFKLEDDEKEEEYQDLQIFSPTATSSQNSNRIYLFQNPQQSGGKTEEKDKNNLSLAKYQKQIYNCQTEQTQESSGEESFNLKEKEECEENSKNQYYQKTQNLTQTAKQREKLNFLYQSPHNIKLKIDNTLTQRKYAIPKQFSQNIVTSKQSEYSSSKSNMKISVPISTKNKEEPKQFNQFFQYFKSNQSFGNILKKDSNFSQQIKLIPDQPAEQKMFVPKKSSLQCREKTKDFNSLSHQAFMFNNTKQKDQQPAAFSKQVFLKNLSSQKLSNILI